MAELLQPQLTDIQLRAKLEEMVINDLLGPAGGPEEEITERNVHDRYLVGVLAPRTVTTAPVHTSAKASTTDTEPEEEEETPAIPDELAEGGEDSIDDGKTDQDVPVAQAHFPSSIGFTFSVGCKTKSLVVAASWGHYLKVRKENQFNERTGAPLWVWKRHARGGQITISIPAKDGTIQPQPVDPEVPDVYIQGRVRQRDSHCIITLFLVNGQIEERPNKDRWFLFQPELSVKAADGSAVFEKKLDRQLSSSDPSTKLEDQRMGMLYRRQVEFAVGHGVSVHADVSMDRQDRAVRVKTTIIPSYEVAKTTPPTAADANIHPAFAKLAGLVLDMKILADTPQKDLRQKLEPLTLAYKTWIDAQEAKTHDPAEGLPSFKDAAASAITNFRQTLKRIEEGIAVIATDTKGFEAFRFMNRAMWLQRTRSLYSEQIRQGKDVHYDDVDEPKNRTWYPFQLAFILLNVPSITNLDHADRSESQEATADLLFFPTGGGKSEAYLGLSAYTMGLRRLQGTVAGRSGENGIAVLMRYTLRLLTLQQFQRATALLCACESIRRQDESKWGKTPFRIGLWVGSKTTPNWTEDAAEAIMQHRGNQHGYAHGGLGTPYQLTACPWCGSTIEPGKHLESKPFKQGSGRTITFCGDKTGQCMFSRRQTPEEGLPVVVVDEEIYRRLPTMLIATVDKFAQMPWKGEVEMLFGQVNGYCTRHGFRSPDLEDSDSHPARNGMPAAKTVQQNPLRPPDLIIQDELHLISGPLGTLVGLYETALDKLCTWDVDGKKVRPKVVASTATIRNADAQVHKLFLRKLNIFPPPGLDVRDNFFSLKRTPSEEIPGRLYLGICAPGKRLKAALIRVYVAFLCAGQALYDQYGKATDPWMTLVGYFNSMRELGGMRRLVDDDVSLRCKKQDRRGLSKRFFGTNYLAELTSRMRSEEIPRTLDLLEAIFDPELEAKRKEMQKGKDWKNAPKRPLDVLLATNMLSVGVDVKRLGLMVVAGQPKATAEYIQATSRVGRNKPGIVVTVYNWARPRDLSHYETFEHYHATFYKQVEALSVTPFSPGALQRGLAGLLVSLIRLRGIEFNSNESAGKIQITDPYVLDAVETIAERAELVGDGTAVGDYVRAKLKEKLDLWQHEAQNTSGGRTLTYKEGAGSNGGKRGTTVSLLYQPGLQRWEQFTCLNSLREVEPSVKLIVDDFGLDDIDSDTATTPSPEAATDEAGRTGKEQE
jgi:ribosomal protein L24E